MQKNLNFYQRQNEQRAIILLMASTYCLRKEKRIRYFMITMAILICLSGIFNKYLDKIFPNYLDIKQLSDTLSQIIILVSGGILITNMFLERLATRIHIEGINLLELYDIYVFGLPQNKSIMRPISETVIMDYAMRMRRRKRYKFKNYYFKSQEQAEVQNCVFNFQKSQFSNEHTVMLNIHPIFLVMWFSFFAVIVIAAVLINDNFVSSLINILIPSFSAISIIMGSQYNFSLQMQKLTSILNVVKEAEEREDINDKMVLRVIQDGLFNQRMNSFMIPSFMVNRIQKRQSQLFFADLITLPIMTQMRSTAKDTPEDIPKLDELIAETKKTVQESIGKSLNAQAENVPVNEEQPPSQPKPKKPKTKK